MYAYVLTLKMKESESVIHSVVSAARQAPLFMEFSRQGYWGGSPFPSPGDRLYHLSPQRSSY